MINFVTIEIVKVMMKKHVIKLLGSRNGGMRSVVVAVVLDAEAGTAEEVVDELGVEVARQRLVRMLFRGELAHRMLLQVRLVLLLVRLACGVGLQVALSLWPRMG